MLELKLAEYENGKFERFLELGEDFGYFGDFLIIRGEERGYILDNGEWHDYAVLGKIESAQCGDMNEGRIQEFFMIKKDEKDPLNRFNGLFDGRTYGNGRFVLIEEKEDLIEVIETAKNKIRGYGLLDKHGCVRGYGFKFDKPFLTEDECDSFFNYTNSVELKNIHQNPELWEKVK